MQKSTRPPHGRRDGRTTPRGCTAIVGGDGRRLKSLSYGPATRVFPAPKYGGTGRIHSLRAALRSRRITAVILLVRLIDHSTSETIKRLCRRLGIPVRLFKSGAGNEGSSTTGEK